MRKMRLLAKLRKRGGPLLFTLAFVAAFSGIAFLNEWRLASGAVAAAPQDFHQALVDRHMSSEAALAVEERKAVAAVRSDLWQDEEQMRAAVRKIRRDFRARTGTLTERHDTEKKALD